MPLLKSTSVFIDINQRVTSTVGGYILDFVIVQAVIECIRYVCTNFATRFYLVSMVTSFLSFSDISEAYIYKHTRMPHFDYPY